jgi:hypothetical protein
MTTIGTCDVCETKDVEISRYDLSGLETWACNKCTGWDDDPIQREIERDTRNAISLGKMFTTLFKG